MRMTHTDFGTDAGAHKRAKFNVTVLVLAQAILGSQMPMIFTIGGLAGQTLAPNPCYATLPISLIVLGSMFAAKSAVDDYAALWPTRWVFRRCLWRRDGWCGWCLWTLSAFV